MLGTVRGLLVAGAVLVVALLAVNMLAGGFQQRAQHSGDPYTPPNLDSANSWGGKSSSTP